MTPSFSDFFPSEVFAFVSDRSVDFTLTKDQLEYTQSQKDSLNSFFDEPLPELFYFRQIHSKEIIALKEKSNRSQKNFLPEADGVITNLCNVPLAVRTADCLSLFMYNPKKHCIGLVHAGWRGSQKGIVYEALKSLRVNFGSEPQDLKIAFGPCIRNCCYQVGEEFKKYFPRDTILRGKSFYFDLVQANKNQLIHLGVKPENIFDCGVCTHCSEQYFSYRRDSEKAGRMISLMMLRK